MPKAELLDITGGWVERMPEVAAQVRVPVHSRQAEFGHLISDDAQVAEFKAAFTSAPWVDARLVPNAGHCIDFHLAAKAFQLEQLAFALEAVLQTQRPADALVSLRPVQVERLAAAEGIAASADCATCGRFPRPVPIRGKGVIRPPARHATKLRDPERPQKRPERRTKAWQRRMEETPVGYQTGTVGPLTLRTAEGRPYGHGQLTTSRTSSAHRRDADHHRDVLTNQVVSRGSAYVHDEVISPEGIPFMVYIQAARRPIRGSFGWHSGVDYGYHDLPVVLPHRLRDRGGDAFFTQEAGRTSQRGGGLGRIAIAVIWFRRLESDHEGNGPFLSCEMLEIGARVLLLRPQTVPERHPRGHGHASRR